jgi:hypothetical protein
MKIFVPNKERKETPRKGFRTEYNFDNVEMVRYFLSVVYGHNSSYKAVDVMIKEFETLLSLGVTLYCLPNKDGALVELLFDTITTKNTRNPHIDVFSTMVTFTGIRAIIFTAPSDNEDGNLPNDWDIY